MHPRTRSQNFLFLNFDPEIERIGRRNRREARLRRAEMGDQNPQLGQMGLPPVVNQNQGELRPEAGPVRFKRVCLMLGMSTPYGITQCLE